MLAVAFSPDGTRLAVQRADLTIVEPDGSVLRSIDVPPAHRLDGANAWSPDGALLATSLDVSSACSLDDPDTYIGCAARYAEEMAFVDATGSGAAVPERLPQAQVGYHGVVGWTGPDTVVVLAGVDDPDPYLLTEVPLRGDEPRVLTAIPTAGANFGVGAFQLATALLPDLQAVDAAAADHGPWPVPLRIGAAAALGLTAAAVVGYTRRRLGALSTTSAGLVWPVIAPPRSSPGPMRPARSRRVASAWSVGRAGHSSSRSRPTGRPASAPTPSSRPSPPARPHTPPSHPLAAAPPNPSAFQSTETSA